MIAAIIGDRIFEPSKDPWTESVHYPNFCFAFARYFGGLSALALHADSWLPFLIEFHKALDSELTAFFMENIILPEGVIETRNAKKLNESVPSKLKASFDLRISAECWLEFCYERSLSGHSVQFR